MTITWPNINFSSTHFEWGFLLSKRFATKAVSVPTHLSPHLSCPPAPRPYLAPTQVKRPASSHLCGRSPSEHSRASMAPHLAPLTTFYLLRRHGIHAPRSHRVALLESTHTVHAAQQVTCTFGEPNTISQNGGATRVNFFDLLYALRLGLSPNNSLSLIFASAVLTS